MAYTRAQFIAKVAPLVQANSRIVDILASLTIAQAILESGNGNSALTTEGNALFGIKVTSSWRGKVWTGRTVEYNDGTSTVVTAGFRAYDSWEESIEDHSALLLNNSRYSKVIGEKDYRKACQYIAQAGYATDPNYAQKLISLIETNNLTQYDEPDYTNTVDEPLFNAVSKIIKSGISLEFNKWKRKDLMGLKNVETLLRRLTGEATYEQAVEVLVERQIISQRSIWDTKSYNTSHVRSLLIKFAASLD